MRSWLAPFVIVSLSCGEPTPPPATDANVIPDAPVDAFVFVPSVPLPPAPPSLRPCPTGWREVVLDGIDACDPWPATGREDCPEGDVHLPGEPGCRPLGAPCPAGDFADDLPASGVVHVLAGAPAGGDGSRGAPFTTIDEGLAALAGSSVLAIGKGSYTARLRIETDLEVIGACVAETIITRLGGVPNTLSVGLGARAVVANVTLTQPPPGIDTTVFVNDAELTLRGVSIRRGTLLVSGGTLVAEDLEVASIATGLGVAGISSLANSNVEIRRALLHDLGGTGVYIGGEGSWTLSDVAIVRTASPGAIISAASSSALRRAYFEHNGETAIQLVSRGITLEDVVVVAPYPAAESPGSGYGIQSFGADATLTRVAVHEAPAGARIAGDGGTLVFRDFFMRDSTPTAVPVLLGRGIEVGRGSTVRLERAHFVRARDIGLLAYDLGTLIEGTDVTFDDIGSNAAGVFGRGVHAQTRGRIALERARFTGCREASVTATNAGTSVELTDVTIESTLPRECALTTCPGAGAGIGVSSLHDAAIRIARFEIADNALCGVQLSMGGTVDLDDGVVERNPIGANIQTDPFDVVRLTRRVVYRENGMNLDSAELVVPDTMIP